MTSDHSVVFKAKGEGTCDFVFTDENEVGLKDLSGFDVYNGNSLFCHFEGSGESRAYIRKLSEKMSVHALTEETTIFINGEEIEIIGDGLFTSIASFRPNWWAFMKGTDITTLPILPITVAERIICMKRILSKFKR